MSLLEIEDLHVTFPIRSGSLRRVTGQAHAVDGVDLTVEPGETVGVVGESGCGKTSLARCIVGLVPPQQGRIAFDGKDITHAGEAERRELTRVLQTIFQDPFSSLNPRMTVRQIVTAGWRLHPGTVAKERWPQELSDLLERVGLSARDADRYPHQFSGGQRQRIGVARALALRPRLIVCDEPVSALDVSVQAQILNLLDELKRELGVALVFISHDLSVVRHISDRVAVMYLGRIVETAPKPALYARPAHPYTQALLSSIRDPEPWAEESREPIVLEGDVPSPIDPPSGCRFRTRCWKAEDRCAQESPALVVRDGIDHPAACHFAAADEAGRPAGAAA